MNENSRIQKFLQTLSEEEKKVLYEQLKIEIGIHPLENEIGLSGDAVLSAIQKMRAEAPLTWRMLRGVLAETTYGVNVLTKIVGWSDITPIGDLPYDYLITDGTINIRIQIKLQRSKDFVAMTANQARKDFRNDMYVVETQKTRGGKDELGSDTRPYKFNEFDILAVCMQPSTGKWDDYMYSLDRWLIPDPKNSNLLLKFQPVAMSPDNDWTDSLETAIGWFTQGNVQPKTITWSHLP